MSTSPNRELAALPNLFLLNPKNRAFVEGRVQHVGTKITSRLYIVTVLLLLILGIIIFRSSEGVFAITMYGFLWLFAVAALGHFRRLQRLAQSGQLLNGNIAEWSAHDTGEGDVRVGIRYMFSTPTGKSVSVVETKVLAEYPKQFGQLITPVQGTPVAVLYVDDGCYEVL